MVVRGKRHHIRLSVEGYEFPHPSRYADWCDDWLNLSVSCSDAEVRFSVTDPCLLTMELSGIIKEFKAVLAGDKFFYLSGSFIEPCLSFGLAGRGGNFVLGIRFVYDMSADEWKTVSAAQRLDRAGLCAVIDEMESWLKQYPVRFP